VTKRRRALLALVTATGVLLPISPAHADNVRDAQWHLGYLNVAEAQRLGNDGAGISVAVIDSGVDATHTDLAGNVTAGADFVKPGGDGRLDIDGHGTAMAGLIAGHGHGTASGALGIAPKAQVVPVRVTEVYAPVGDRDAQGISWAAQHNVKVMCVAVGGPANDPKLQKTVEQAQAADIVVVAAVGNRTQVNRVVYPAAYPGVIAVSGVDKQGNHADVSVTGPEVTLAAPAVDVVSTDPNNRYSSGLGTSAATAIIAGVAALVRAKYPQLSATEVVHRLTATATDKGAPGRDSEYGYGIVNPVAALTADVPPLKPSAAPTTTGLAPIATPPIITQPAKPSRAPLVIGLAVVGLLVVAGGVTFAVARSKH
jgi:type VII secretion-associated serine protease mycosin